MPFYETVFIARQDLAEGQVKELTESLSKVLTDNGGKIHKIEQWGLRKFAYKINKNSKGHYVLIECDAPSDAVIEMERQMRLNEEIVRSLTVRLDALSTGLSVVMDKDRERNNSEDRYSNREREAA